MSEPKIIATFLTRCGCSADCPIKFPPPLKMYRALRNTQSFAKMLTQEELSMKPTMEIREFILTVYGYREEPDPNTIHVLYEEIA